MVQDRGCTYVRTLHIDLERYGLINNLSISFYILWPQHYNNKNNNKCILFYRYGELRLTFDLSKVEVSIPEKAVGNNTFIIYDILKSRQRICKSFSHLSAILRN